MPLHEWVEGHLVSLGDAGGVPWAMADAVSKKRDAELAELLAQGPPGRGSVEKPITWVFEPESFASMARLCGGDVLSVVCDHLGTPALMVDGNGARVWSAGLSAWGELRLLEGERFACPFRWPGQYEDAETGLYYNRFRYYDPESGQYTRQDPIGLRGGFAFYAYPSDPLRIIDPLGLQPCGPNIHPGKQGKHVPGHNNFQPGKSELSHPNPQALLDQYHGTGVPHGATKEVVDFQEPIGLYLTQEGGRRTTTRGTIHYSADRAHAHIVPAKPTEDL
ncbi:MAG: hypothetical protein RLZZ450_7733 [Pseudomonadota bacterium]